MLEILKIRNLHFYILIMFWRCVFFLSFFSLNYTHTVVLLIFHFSYFVFSLNSEALNFRCYKYLYKNTLITWECLHNCNKPNDILRLNDVKSVWNKWLIRHRITTVPVLLTYCFCKTSIATRPALLQVQLLIVRHISSSVSSTTDLLAGLMSLISNSILDNI